MAKRIVIALGGNALGNTPEEQIALVRKSAVSIIDLVKKGYEIIIGHGNGPQVGMINLAMEYAAKDNENIAAMPFPECGAMSQGYIGYHLQQALSSELRRQNLAPACATIITQVVVKEDDPAFAKPTKPIGSFYTKEEADEISKAKGYTFVEDSGRGYRRVVPSPQPVEIVEQKMIAEAVANGNLVIAVGGGGIPVIRHDDQTLEGVAAVIDKDLSSAKLAADLHADMLVILTAVEQVYINFNQPNQQALDSLTIPEAEQYISEGQFAAGSMLPKVEACLQFVNNSENGSAIITALETIDAALAGKTGTKITNQRVRV